MTDQTVTQSLQQKMVMDEIAGKNNAIQTYDQQLWTIRSGFLTLLFAGWGALLALAGQNTQLLLPISYIMLFVSWSLAITGFLIDANYVTRKFKCIHALTVLVHEAFQFIDRPENMNPRWLEVSGDNNKIRLSESNVEGVKEAYRWGLFLSALLYLMPPLGITLGTYAALAHIKAALQASG